MDGLDFRVLGPAEVVAGGRAVPLGGSRPLIVLAGLLLRVNRVVSVAELGRWLWEDDQRRSKGALQTYVLRLRRALGEGVVIRTERGGYLLELDPSVTDLGRFRALAARGRTAFEQGEHRRAAALFADALAEWRGPALQNVESDALHLDEAGQLAEERTRVRELWADALIAVGEFGTVVPELTRLTREHPLRERLHEQLVLALFHSGRQAEALEVYRRIGAVLADELGLDPGAGLQRVHRLVLGGAPYQPAVEPQVPHQLPADLGAFAGREADLKALRALVPADDSTSTPIASVEGMGGMGKTTLSVHFAHEVVDRFPGGQVFLNLRGYGPGDPVEPLAALETLLSSLGVPGEQIPAEVDSRAALWRTHTAGRRVLVVLDNANSTEQVRALLPGPGCLVVVTSRWQLRGLVATHGARRIALEELDEAGAVELLASAIGVDRVNADPAATSRFVEYCGGLPLAIRILAVRAAQFPDLPIGSFVDSLAGFDRLGLFDLGDGDDTNVRAVFSYSYRALPGEAGRLLRLLGLLPGPDVTPAVAEVLLGSPPGPALDALVSAHLLTQPQPGRYQFHDLIRAYAAELSYHVDSAEDSTAARLRLLDFYLFSAFNASRAMRPDRIYGSLELSGDGGLTFADYHAGLAWFAEEYGNLVAVVHLAFRLRAYPHCWKLTWLMFTYFAGRARVDDWRALNELALRGTRISGDRGGEAGILNCLGVIDGVVRDYASARRNLQQALALQRELGSREGAARALYNLAMAADSPAEFPAALAHGTEALEIVRDLRLPGFEANVLRALGDLCCDFGDFPRALSLADEALKLAPTPRDGRFSLVTRAKALLGLGRSAEGIECMSDAVDMFFSLDEHYEAADVLARLGTAHQRLGHPAAARDCWLRSVRLLTDLSHPDAATVRAKLAAMVSG
ncbi:BTAD domain-containing putative transcriptional regulator [Amycolatopsis rhabdoformis]|uniref:BTAD domain-containing putative transcriptional regulator n=1 Tax=Amycolatopsis rhabdoformis TaxID=1448059 RepID=A0ABZ1HZK4_9PSEU|nr:BTAD domain-containing putative transcriptional regulator [Amycolatopsis rhabdoformis]WSE27569.1 BTAD domain-containing putative transcriptional regulator [Amycolatopsis rhabdoformis]